MSIGEGIAIAGSAIAGAIVIGYLITILIMLFTQR